MGNRNAKFDARLDLVPYNPGVYLMKDASGLVIYVGKAKDLNKEVLFNNIDNVLNDKELYKSLSKNSKKMGEPNSATKIYEEIKKLK